ncbi:hypothetical protein Nmel_001586 [Mimus melanotis]
MNSEPSGYWSTTCSKAAAGWIPCIIPCSSRRGTSQPLGVGHHAPAAGDRGQSFPATSYCHCTPEHNPGANKACLKHSTLGKSVTTGAQCRYPTQNERGDCAGVILEQTEHDTASSNRR